MTPTTTSTDGTESEIPTEPSELDAHTTRDLVDADNGDELWIPVSTIYGNQFRAVKVRVLDRISVNNFEEINAVDPWPQCDRHPTNHEIAEGINGTQEAGSDCENQNEPRQ